MNCNQNESHDAEYTYELDIHTIIDDIWIDIFFFLNGVDFISMNQTCKYFHHLTCESSIKNSKYHIRTKEHFAIVTKHQYLNIQRMVLTISDKLSEIQLVSEAARSSVKGIKQSQLNDVRCFEKPPMLIQMTFETACILLNKEYGDWREIRAHIGKVDFISDLLEFDTTTVTPKMIKLLEQKYLSNEQFTYDRVNKLSKVCGPIVQWIKAQVKFAHLLHSIDTIGKELKLCKHQFNQNKQKYFVR